MQQLDEHIRRLTEGTARIKLPGGIVGKTSYVLIAFCTALAAIVASIRTVGIGYAAIGSLTLVVPIVIWWLIRFAKDNPAPAILEGAEYVVYQRMQLAQKNFGVLPPSPAEPASPEPVLPPAQAEALKKPDLLPLEDTKLKRRIKNV